MYAYFLYPHVVNNCVKRHINIPTYSTTGENVVINEFVQGQPIYQQPMMFQQGYYPYGMPQYQGNVGVEGLQQPQQFSNMVNPMNPYNF